METEKLKNSVGARALEPVPRVRDGGGGGGGGGEEGGESQREADGETDRQTELKRHRDRIITISEPQKYKSSQVTVQSERAPPCFGMFNRYSYYW